MGGTFSGLENCASVTYVERNPYEKRTANDSLSISETSACYRSWENCPKDPSKPSGYAISNKCAVPCQFVIPANTSVSSMEISRFPKELIPIGREAAFPESAQNKLYIKPSMPFKLAYNGLEITVDKMVLYHPCPVRIENIQYDAVLQLNDPSLSSITESKNDTVILIPLAGTNRPDEAGALISKIAPFITGLADTASGDVEQTGGTTVAASNPVQQSRCDAVQNERDRRWGITISSSVDNLKRKVIQLARKDGSKWFNKPGGSNGGGGQIVRQYNQTGPDRVRQAVARGESIFSDDAYLWDIYENSNWSDSWGDRFDDGDNWETAKKLIATIREQEDKIAERGTASEERQKKKQEQEFLNMVETGIPDPNEPITPCEILNVGVGQDWSLSKLIPVGANGIVNVPYFTWTSSKVQQIDQRSNPKNCTAEYGVRPNGFFVRYIVMERPVRISSADLRSIRSLPPVTPTKSGVRFIETRGILYKNAPPENCKTCDTAGDAVKVAEQLKKGKLDKKLLFNVVFSLLGAIVLVMGVYFGLKWAMGPKGEIFKNLGVKVGSYAKGIKDSRTTALPKGFSLPSPSEKSKVADIVPAVEITKEVPTITNIGGPRRRSTVASTLS